MGASNELPESEELDALYDRFLIRRSVAQVSSSQLGNLARLAAGTRLVAEAPSNGASSNGAATPPADAQAGPGLDLEDFRSVQADQCPSCNMSVCLSVCLPVCLSVLCMLWRQTNLVPLLMQKQT